MHPRPFWPDRSPESAENSVYSRFDVAGEPVHRQLLAWRDRVGHVIDVVPLREQLVQPFRGVIERFNIGDLVFTDCRTDEIWLERSIARISRDNVRSFAFHVFLEGSVEAVVARPARRSRPSAQAGILALDMDQPVRMRRHACRVLTFFVSGSVLQDLLVDPATVHGRVIGADLPIARLITGRTAALAASIHRMNTDDAARALQAIVQLLAEAYGRQAGLLGSARAAGRAAMLDNVLRHIRTHLHDADLSPESVLQALGLPRSTVYRLFRQEGGLEHYIRGVRLRGAAEELVRFPLVPVKDIAYAFGFRSASDFSRAFRRAYDMTPQEIRMTGIWGF